LRHFLSFILTSRLLVILTIVRRLFLLSGAFLLPPRFVSWWV